MLPVPFAWRDFGDYHWLLKHLAGWTVVLIGFETEKVPVEKLLMLLSYLVTVASVVFLPHQLTFALVRSFLQ